MVLGGGALRMWSDHKDSLLIIGISVLIKETSQSFLVLYMRQNKNSATWQRAFADHQFSSVQSDSRV